MKRQRIFSAASGVVALVLLVWIMRNTYWDQVALPTSMRGEAARYPLYAAELLAKQLGVRTYRDSLFPAPAADSVIYLSNWTWDLGRSRRNQLEQWVESGGRLVIDGSVHLQKGVFRDWSGIENYDPRVSKQEMQRRAGDEVGSCEDWRQSGIVPIAGDPVDRTYLVCNQVSSFRIRAPRHTTRWALQDRDGMLAVRVSVGKGSVTAIVGQPFVGRSLLSGDHAELFVAVTQLSPGDRIHFLSEARHPSLVALSWRHGAPAIALAGLTLALALWRRGTRFGPTAPAMQPLRRSLTEQIRGSGEFALRYGGGAVLHAAVVRALRSAANRRIPGFATMTTAEQAAALAQAGATTADAMLAALQPAQTGRPRSLLATLALLESARRRILSGNPRQIHGN